jgi:serine/threonine protein kinase
MGGLAHSDLSYKNILIDPKGINACIIDIDSLVVPTKYPPDVMGTPDFIAPEVLKTSHLAKDDKNRIHPSADTDRHALAVLIYLYLFFRHPLRGGKNHDLNDSANDEKLMMGEKALFIEHPSNKENRVKHKPDQFMPWVDPDKIPYTIAGDFLVPLFNRAFIDGLHNPSKRPTAIEWETALAKSMDLLLKCPNSNCTEKWYIFNNALKPSCPFCGTKQDRMPILNLYKLSGGSYMSENVRAVVYNDKALLKYNTNASIPFDERSNPTVDKKVVGYFKKKKEKWYLKNDDIPDLTDANTKQKISIGSEVELTEGTTLILDKNAGGRSIMVQMIG